MVAVDTNVLVRFLTHDHPGQTAKAVSLFQSQEIWLSKTVILETHWVLSRLFGFPPPAINQSIERLLALPNVRAEDATSVRQALDWCAHGLEFADALHLASRGPASRFVTFDARFSKRALGAGIGGIEPL